ncbi:putative non-specific serine/threonine protein kinase [Helianthus anomalus]
MEYRPTEESICLVDWAHSALGHRRPCSQGLEGSLSPHVGNLSFLHGLSLSNNSFQGAIPHEIGRLSRLLVLSVGTNKFSGVIPANISGCSNLVVIGLAKNELVGSIPKEISFLLELSFLLLQNNKLTGGISPFLGNITTMVVFGTHGNPLGGSIPDTLSHWKNLEEIYCSHCNLSGTIAPMYNLSLLTEVRFANNQLTGSLPLALGTMLPQLVSLYLWGNQLTGPLPPTISNCSRLSDLQMNKNKFRGKLTIDFSKLRDIYFITIGSNNFGSKEIDEMKFINSLENCTKLTYLDISDCNFQGV